MWRVQPLFFNLRQHIRAVNSAEPDSGDGLVHRLRFASWVSVKMMDKNTDAHTIEGDRHRAGFKVFSQPRCLVLFDACGLGIIKNNYEVVAGFFQPLIHGGRFDDDGKNQWTTLVTHLQDAR